MPHRILVVDTHPLNRLVIAEQIATLGLVAITADDGEDALALFESGRFDLVLVECRMQGMNGFMLTTRIRDLAWARGEEACPVIGYAEDPEVDTALAAYCGMRACLPMPISLPALARALRDALPANTNVARVRDTAQWDLFVATTREDLRQARECVRDGRTVVLREIFHRIKGAALMIGESDLAAACARGESGCEEWSTLALTGAIDLVQSQLDAADARVGRGAQWAPSR